MLISLEINTPVNESLTDITDQINQLISKSLVREGTCIIFIPHTTAAITINSAMDKNTPLDIISEVRRLVPTRVDFLHQYDTPSDASGHIKATLIGCSASLIISNGKLLLGSSQSVLLFDFDGPRKRTVHLRIISERDALE